MAKSLSSMISLIMWDYDMDLVRRNLDIFRNSMVKKKGVDVALTYYPWSIYAESVSRRFAEEENCDVLHASNEWLTEWVEDGHVAILEDRVPEIKKYRDDLNDFDRDGLSYKGKMVGLPYYADRFSLLYNDEILRKAGYDQPPKSWAALVEQCLMMKKKRLLRFPFTLALGYGPEILGSDPLEEYFSIAYSMNEKGLPFDSENNPSFQEGSSAREALKLLVNCVQEHHIIDPRSTRMGVVDALNSICNQESAFAVLPSYDLRVINDIRSSKAAGKVRMAIMPESGRTLGYTRSYVMGTAAEQTASWSLIEFLGGRTDPLDTGVRSYFVQKQWALEHGVNFSQASLWDDPDVSASFSRWLDIDLFRKQAKLAVNLPRARWWRRWYETAAPILAEAIRGKIAVEEACRSFTDHWNRLRADR